MAAPVHMLILFFTLHFATFKVMYVCLSGRRGRGFISCYFPQKWGGGLCDALGTWKMDVPDSVNYFICPNAKFLIVNV
jgi:hypothetical protein